jgi:hypothetical protein
MFRSNKRLPKSLVWEALRQLAGAWSKLKAARMAFFPHLQRASMDSDFWTSLAVCVALLIPAVWMLSVQWRQWQQVDADTNMRPARKNHLRCRYRRRMQVSTMLGCIGIAFLGGELFPPEEGLVPAIYWICVALLVLWMALLAVADMVATRMYYSRLQEHVDLERTKLEVQIRRFQQEEAKNTDDSPALPSLESDDSRKSPGESEN